LMFPLRNEFRTSRNEEYFVFSGTKPHTSFAHHLWDTFHAFSARLRLRLPSSVNILPRLPHSFSRNSFRYIQSISIHTDSVQAYFSLSIISSFVIRLPTEHF
jgi:hypothetical protein